jgi:hypothetical protein
LGIPFELFRFFVKVFFVLHVMPRIAAVARQLFLTTDTRIAAAQASNCAKPVTFVAVI